MKLKLQAGILKPEFFKSFNRHIVLLGALCLFLHWLVAQQTDPKLSFPLPKHQTLTSPEELIKAKVDRDAAFKGGAQQVLHPIPLPKINKNSKSFVFLEKADVMLTNPAFPGVKIISQNVRFRQDQTYLYCDSAYFYEEENSLDAFGNVHMIQGDTLHLYGDVLFYDGNSKQAHLKYNVRMENKGTVLTTDSLLYDRIVNVGYYTTGGRITNGDNVLTSLIGQYYPTSHTAYFKTAVKLVNPDFVMRSDTLQYDTHSGVATIVGPTNIVHKNKTTITSTSGWYDTHTDHSQLLNRSIVRNPDGRQLTADTIFYDKKQGIGNAYHNVEINDTAQQVTLYGHYGYYDDNKSYGFVTKHAQMVQRSKEDTLYMHADTLAMLKDSTFKSAKGYHNVRFFRSDLQGKCDSIFYSDRDSVMRMYGQPVLWSDEQQISGEEIHAYSKNKEIEHIHVIRAAFAIQQSDSIRFNQLSGKDLKAYIRNREIYRIDVSGNSESLYFPRDKDSTLIGMNTTQSSFLTMYIKDKKVDKIILRPQSNGTLYPPEKTKKDQMFLKNYNWQEATRPKNKEDIFTFIPKDASTNSGGRRKQIGVKKTTEKEDKKEKK
ncbi:MAG: OstA-like protein [Bacteroidota bacterium]|nr:OstA-like protein [Bacteroidota bacterium]